MWPRGIGKADLALGEWLKDVAPSTDLRRWFHADPPARFEEFERRYRVELADNPALARLREVVSDHPAVTLLYSSKDIAHNHAQILTDILAG